MQRLHSKTLLVLIGLSVYKLGLCSEQTSLDTASVGSKPEVFEVSYKVKARGFKVGKLKTRIERNDDHFKVQTHTVASRMVSLFVKGKLQDECEFRLLADGSIKPISYSAERTGKNSYKKSVEYDWLHKSIVYQDDSKQEFPSEYLLDNCNFYIAVALSQGVGAIAKPFKVLDAGEHRSRDFNIVSIEYQDIQSTFGMLATIKITIDRTDTERRRTIFWLSKEYPLSPIKIRDERKGKATTLTLETITAS